MGSFYVNEMFYPPYADTLPTIDKVKLSGSIRAAKHLDDSLASLWFFDGASWVLLSSDTIRYYAGWGIIINEQTITLDTTVLGDYWVKKRDSVPGGYYPYSTNPKGYLTQESDTLALNKYIGHIQGYGMVITGTTYQRLGSPPSWTHAVDTNSVATRNFVQKLIDIQSTRIDTMDLVFSSGLYRAPGSNQVVALHDNSLWNARKFQGFDITPEQPTEGVMWIYRAGAFPRWEFTKGFSRDSARLALSLTTSGVSGASTYSSTTGVLNVPNYGSYIDGKTISLNAGNGIQVLGTTTQSLAGTVSWTVINNMTVTNTGTGTPTYNSNTGVLNIPPLTLTTTGTGGATYSATTNTLNIPTPTYVRTAALKLPAPSNAENQFIIRLPNASTVSRVDVILKGTTSPSVTYALHYGSTYGTSLGTIVASNTVTATSSTATLNTTSIPADSYIWLVTSASAGTITDFSVQITF
jgi:hypothetical protein